MTKYINEKLRNTIKKAETLKIITRPSERLREIFAKHAMTQELTPGPATIVISRKVYFMARNRSILISVK